MKKRKLLILLLMAIVMMAMSPTKVWAQNYGTWTRVGDKKHNQTTLNNPTTQAYSNLGNSYWSNDTKIEYLSGQQVSGDVGLSISGKCNKNLRFLASTYYRNYVNVPSYTKVVRTSTYNLYMYCEAFGFSAGIYVFGTEDEAKNTAVDVSENQNLTKPENCIAKAQHTGYMSVQTIQGTCTLTYDNSTGTSAADKYNYLTLMEVVRSYDYNEYANEEWATFKEASGTNTFYYYAPITYNANGGTGTMASTTIENSGTLSANTFTCSGKHFKEWNTKADGTGTSYADGATFTVTSSNKGPKTLYAIWENHSYGDPTWEWTGNTSATCTRTCSVCHESVPGHTVSATVTLSGGGITSEVTTLATCVTMGKTTYTAKATVGGTECTDSKIVADVAALGHAYGGPSWTWTGYESATCSRTCTNTGCTTSTTGHTASATVTLSGGGITYAVTTPPSSTETGSGRYTATATVAGSEYSDYKDKDISATGHTEYQHLGEADADGWYSLSNPLHLKDFASKVNNGETSIKGRLTADIDMQGEEYVQIGNTEDNAFKGILDGQFHSIKNLNIKTSNAGGAALIRFTKYATIQKLTVQGTFTTNNQYAAGFIAQNVSDGDDTHYTKIDKCISAVNIQSSRSGDGSHGGFVGVANIPVTLSDCAFIGSITTTNGTSNCAGLVGWSTKGDKSTATNCFVTATFDSGVCQMQMMRNCSDDHFPTCYYVNTYCNNTTHQGTQITPAQLTNGYLCYLLNGNEFGKTDGTQAWYQNIKIDEEDEYYDSHPVLKSTGSNTVYCIYGETCTDQTFNNTSGSGTPNHEYEISWKWAEDGKTAKAIHTCQRYSSHVIETVATVTSQQTLAPTCGAKGETTYTASVNVIGTEQTDTKILADIPATGNHVVPENYDAYGYKYCSSCQNNIPMPLGDADANGWYSLSNAAQLTLFANKVNAGETSIKGRLANDIDMQGQTVVQIGADSEKPFHGELDGQYHAIKNLSISADAEYKASLIGYADKVTIQKLTVQGTITSSSKFASGFIGQTKNNTSKIEKCISAVDIIATIAGDGTHAGFVGVANAKAELSDCAFVGSITSENGTNNCAALVGWDNATSSAQNCYVTGTFTNGICQNPLMRHRGNEFPTCYYLNEFLNADGTPLTSVQGNQFTAQQLDNGELCYLLNGGENYKTDGTQAWYQKIGADDCPVLTSAAGNTVYCVYGETCESEKTYNNTAASGSPNHTKGSDITWTWASDGQSATATYTCGRNSSHQPVVNATITSVIKTPATCTAMGTTTYTAKINIAGTDYTNNKDVVNLAIIDHNLTSTADDDIKSCTMCNKKILSAVKVSVSQNSNAIETAQIENTDNRQVFQFVDGKVVMTLGEGSAHVAEMPLAEGAKMTIKGVTYNEDANKTSLSVSSAGYATFSSAFQLAVPDNENIQIYAPEMKDGNIYIGSATKLAANTVVPAATGLLVKGNEGDYNVEYSSAEAPEVTSALTASVVARPTTDYEGQIYALGMNPGIGFYRFSSDKTDARKAFLLLPAGSSARIGFITDDVSTSISQPAIISLPTGRAGESLYNLAGQRVSHNTRGIIIVNGKKYINK